MSAEMRDHMQAITAQITHEIDVSAYLPQKLSALSCHQTQLTEHSPFYHLIKPELSDMFSPEFFVEVRQPEGTAGSGEDPLI